MKRFVLYLVLTLVPLMAVGQGVVEGVVTDAKNGDPLEFVNVGIPGQQMGTVTNAKGYYRFLLKGEDSVTVRLQVAREATLARFERRVDLCRYVAKRLGALASLDSNKMTTFSVVELLEQYNATMQGLAFGSNEKSSLGDIEEALLYLSRLGLLKIEGGFMVIYSTIQLRRLVTPRTYYGKEQYRLLDEFYRQRIQQIHIVGEYANMMVRDYDAALQFVSDYFLMDYRQFVGKYFKGERKKQIVKNITPAKYEQIFGTLSDRQRQIIDDKQSQYIVVAAGPGSGKTRVLVHKLQHTLWISRPSIPIVLTSSAGRGRSKRSRVWWAVRRI